MTPAIIWGGTGQAKVLREALRGSAVEVIALFDNRDIPSPFPEVPLFIGEAGFADWASAYSGPGPVVACVAIGGGHGRDRIARLHWLRDKGHPLLTVVHPRAFLASDAVVGDGCQLLAMSAVCASARLGEGVIVNTGASVDHDCIVGDGAHIAPGAHVAGEAVIGEHAFIGTGAIVLPRIRIGRGATVGAGAVVTRDVPAGDTVVGNPARKHHQEGQ